MKLFYLFTLMILLGTEVQAQDLILPEQEAPAALFEADIGDADVDFYLTGSWTASLGFSTGILFGPDGVQFPVTVPGLETVQPFRQVPDLTFAVWLMERFFAEATVIGDFFEDDYDYLSQNTVRMGYEGKDTEFLQHLYLGNRGINFTPYPYIAIADSGESSLGIEALAETGISSHRLMLRYDNNTSDSLTYIGSNLVEEFTLSLDNYVQGRFFKLPDADVANLQVYLEDPQGIYTGSDQRRYRLAELEDVYLDAVGGEVRLNKTPEGSVLVYYTKSGLEIGAAALGAGALVDDGGGLLLDPTGPAIRFEWGLAPYLGQDMMDRQVTVNGRAALRLWQFGEFSPFELLGAYLFPETAPTDLSRIRMRAVIKGLATEIDSPVKFKTAPGADTFSAYINSNLRGDLRNLYPFLDENAEAIFDPENRLYGPARDSKAGYQQQELLVGFLTPVMAYDLGQDIISGSVRVLRNGVEESRYDIDYDTGVLTFNTVIFPDDRLEISFRRPSLLTNGDLLFAWGNTISLNERLDLDLATGLRWNLLAGGYTDEPYTRTGTVLGSVSLDGNYGPLTFTVETGLAFTNPDTTGTMRLLGMEDQGLSVSLGEGGAWPGARPLEATLPVMVPAFSTRARGRLYYKDYRAYTALGSGVLQPYSWTPPASQVYAYENGKRAGPYNVAESREGEGKGQSLVFDFDADADDWVGFQMPVRQGLSDLSNLQSLTLSYRVPESAGTFDLYLQLGELGEDLDGDAVLDEELSANATGFTFYDADNGAALLVGAGPQLDGNGRRDSEDVDGSGFLDPETAANIVTLSAGSISGIQGWTTQTFYLDANQRQALRRTRGLRILAVESASSPCSAVVLIDSVHLDGTTFSLSTTHLDPDDLTVQEIDEDNAKIPALKTLEERFPEVEDLLHPAGEEQKVLELSWNIAPANSWTLSGFLPEPTGGIDYKKLKAYIRIPAGTSGQPLEFDLLDVNDMDENDDTDDNGIHWDFIPGSLSEWTEMIVDLDSKQVLLNNIPVGGATVQVRSDLGSLYKLKVSLANVTTGDLYLDEFALIDPKASAGAAASLDATLDFPGDLIMIGEHPLLSDVRFRQRAAVQSPGFSPLYGIPAEALSANALSELSAGISWIGIDAEMQVDAVEDRVALAGGHRLVFPRVASPVVFSDSFSQKELGEGRSLYRSNSLDLVIPLLSGGLGTESSVRDGLLSQSWDFELQTVAVPGFKGSFETKLDSSREGDQESLLVDGYLANWINGYTLLWPWSGGTQLERRETLGLDLGLSTKPAGFDLSAQLESRSYAFSGDLATQENGLNIDVSVPLVFTVPGGVAGLSLTSGYRRWISLRDNVAGAGFFGSDLRNWSVMMAGQPYWYNQLPIVELFDLRVDELFRDTADLEQAVYRPELYFLFSRLFSSRIRDLFVPSFVELALSKSYEKQGALYDFYNTYSLTTRSTALNLFGRTGAYPIFPFYRFDEFTGSLTVDLNTSAAGVRDWQVFWEHYFFLEGEGGNAFTVENRFTVGDIDARFWTDRLALLYIWFRYPEKLRLPFVPADFGLGAFWSHEESLEFKLAGEQRDSSGNPLQTSYHPVNIQVSHETSLLFPETGRFSLEAALAMDLERTTNGQLFVQLGIKAGLELVLEF